MPKILDLTHDVFFDIFYSYIIYLLPILLLLINSCVRNRYSFSRRRFQPLHACLHERIAKQCHITYCSRLILIYWILNVSLSVPTEDLVPHKLYSDFLYILDYRKVLFSLLAFPILKLSNLFE